MNYRCPYQEGQILLLHPPNGPQTRVEIVEILKLWTVCPVMLVDVDIESFQNPYLIKLYDYLHSPQLRAEMGLDDWTDEANEEYRQAVGDGSAAEFALKIAEDNSL